jgi:hypothetical protein
VNGDFGLLSNGNGGYGTVRRLARRPGRQDSRKGELRLSGSSIAILNILLWVGGEGETLGDGEMGGKDEFIDTHRPFAVPASAPTTSKSCQSRDRGGCEMEIFPIHCTPINHQRQSTSQTTITFESFTMQSRLYTFIPLLIIHGQLWNGIGSLASFLQRLWEMEFTASNSVRFNVRLLCLFSCI